MKKSFLLFLGIVLASCLWGQDVKNLSAAKTKKIGDTQKGTTFEKYETKDHPDLKTLVLPNGMNVVLCEDHSEPRIWGAVCVHAGGKNDPADNTGMAHYLEHLMFKGTDQIGTLDWKQEKEYLDQISELYDKLHSTKEERERNSILMEINNLSNKSVEFAIPNEVDVILSKMGGQGVNAFTSNDVTVYLNSFPTNQLEKWLMVYAERFRYPVFRLFQSELEAVYEEYNMYQDQPISVFFEDALAEAYGKHPYGRPVIGYQEHLKNPQISAMQKFFNTYYHPNNMTLVLVGDLSIKDITPLLSSTIGNYHNESEGVNPDEAKNTKRMNTDLGVKLEPFSGHKVVTVSETPVKMGIIGFQTVGAQKRDEFYLDILSNFLNNNEETGLLDKLTKDNKLLSANAFNYSMLEHGMYAFFYVPKILGQSHEDAESYVFAAIDSLKTGHFSKELFEAVKMSYLKEYLLDMETLDDKFQMVLSLVTNKNNPNVMYEREMMIRNLTKEQIVKLANRYFTDNCLIFRSNMGTKSQEKLQKPNWKPIIAQNTEKNSEYAQRIESMPVNPVKPQNIDFHKDVTEYPLNEDFTFYGSPNPYNDLFTMTLVYDYGNLNDRLFSTAVQYVQGQGTQKEKFDQFQLELQQMGASMDMYSTDDRLFVSISGFEKKLPEILKLCQEKLYHPGNEKKVLQTIIDDKTGNDKMMKDDASQWGRALYNYAMFGENSPYLTRLTLKELKKMNGEKLLNSFAIALNFGSHVTYVGKTDPKKVAELVKEMFAQDGVKKGERKIRQLKQYDQPTLFLASNGKFLQSNIYFYKAGEPLPDLKEQMDCQLYNEYMGGSMAGVIFQEIRELRSLGYSAYAAYQYDKLNRRPGYLMGFLGTQSDKTVEGCEAMEELLNTFPKKPEKFEMAKTSCIRAAEADYISPRDIPEQVRSWQEQGLKEDPRSLRVKVLSEKDLNNIADFYSKTMEKRPLIITIAGDKSRINLKELSKTYNIVELKYKDFIKE